VESYPIESVLAAAPMFADGEKIAVQQGAGMVVSRSDAAHEYASVVFLKWFTEEDRNIEFSLASGYLPVKKAANDFETIKKVMDSHEELASAEMIDVVEVAEKQLNEVELYTTKAFEGGNDARSLLDNRWGIWQSGSGTGQRSWRRD
ncbi:MAG: extracellular solute-binding protein, partial [Holdemania massiliensis]